MTLNKRPETRLVFIGIDGAMHSFVKRYMKEGLMPNLSSLADRGALFQSIPSVPVDTPTNWTTLMTSSSALTHGVVSFTTHIPGESPEEGQYIRRTQHSSFSKAEMLWSSLERAGRKVAVLNYPVGWPPQLKGGIVIGGLTPGGDVWRIAKPAIYSTEEPLELSNIIKGTRPSFVKLLPRKKDDRITYQIELPSLGQLLKLEYSASKLRMSGKDFSIILKKGEWSPWIYTTDSRRKKCVMRFNLFDLSANGERLILYRTQIFAAEGWAYPNELLGSLLKNAGPYVEGFETPFVSEDPKRPYGPSNLNPEFVLQHAKIQAKWFSDASSYLIKEHKVDSLIMHYHLIDSINHTYLSSLCSEAPHFDEKKAAMVEGLYSKAYSLVDEMIGSIVTSAGKDALIVITSDHSALPCWKYVSVEAALVREGLMKYQETSPGRYKVDMKKSKVFVYHDPLHLWVNLKGREKNGIVDKRDYQDVLEKAEQVLYSIRDEDNSRVMKLVTRREEWGRGKAEERFGDLFFFFRPGYSNWDGTISSLKFDQVDESRFEQLPRVNLEVGGHHTTYLPTESYAGFENNSFTVFSGEGISNNAPSYRPSLRDVASTISGILGAEPPRDCEGAAIFEILS